MHFLYYLLYISLGSILSFMLVRFKHKKHFIRVRKDHVMA